MLEVLATFDRVKIVLNGGPSLENHTRPIVAGLAVFGFTTMLVVFSSLE